MTQAQIISYEEYYPYGSTSYQAGRSADGVTPKRYRYTGKERDEESGLNYHGARYYAPWLGRWVSCDPTGLVDGVSLYKYARSNPVAFLDSSGTDGEVWDFIGGVIESSGMAPMSALAAKKVEEAKRERNPNPLVETKRAVSDLLEGGKVLLGGRARDLTTTATWTTEDGLEWAREDLNVGFEGADALNKMYNPIYQALVLSYEFKEAWERGDYRTAGSSAGQIGQLGYGAYVAFRVGRPPTGKKGSGPKSTAP